MENYIILPSLYYFLSFDFFFNNLRHKISKYQDKNISDALITFFTFALWIVAVYYCGFYAYLTQWYMFPILIIFSILFDMLSNTILTILMAIGANAKIGIFMSLYHVLRNSAVCVVASVFFGFKMLILINV